MQDTVTTVTIARSDDMPTKTFTVQWGGDDGQGTKDFPAPPAVGTRVNVRVNKVGPGTVAGYFVECGFLGVIVKVDEPPQWFLNNTDGDPHIYVFAIEISKLED